MNEAQAQCAAVRWRQPPHGGFPGKRPGAAEERHTHLHVPNRLTWQFGFGRSGLCVGRAGKANG